MTKTDRKNWITKLQPFWKQREIAYNKFRKIEHKIEEQMNKEVGEELEFFYVDGECVGIGHVDLDRRSSKKKNYFPLIHDMELYKQITKNEVETGKPAERTISKGEKATT